MLRALSALAALLLFLAVAQLPIGYYTFLRIAVTIVAVMLLVDRWRYSRWSVWVILFGGIAILFNPFLPIYLYSKSIWIPIDLGVGLIFLVNAIKAGPKPLQNG